MILDHLSADWFDNAACHYNDHDALPPNPPSYNLPLVVSLSLCPSLSFSFSHAGSYLTHEASGLDEHGEVQEAFLNGNDASQGKKEYLL